MPTLRALSATRPPATHLQDSWRRRVARMALVTVVGAVSHHQVNEAVISS
jgi:hypothetical protein